MAADTEPPQLAGLMGATPLIQTATSCMPPEIQPHLANAYGKLGINSRRDLSATLTGGNYRTDIHIDKELP
jgi:hypothetical protein